MTTVIKTLSAALSSIVFLTPPAEARADQKQECSAAYDATQSLRDEGKLLDARRQALVCSGAPCPAFVREDCTQWLSEIDAVVPTVVFTAKDAAGSNTLAVRVILDGRVLLDHLDGSAVAVDPGAHHVHFEIAAMGALEKEIMVQKGQKTRVIDASFESSVAKPSPPLAKPEPAPAPKSAPPPLKVVVPIVTVPAVAPVSEPLKPATPPAPSTPPVTTTPTWARISGGTGLGLAVIGSVGIVSAQASGSETNVFIGLTTVGSMGFLAGLLGTIKIGTSPTSAPKTVSFAPIASPAGGGFLALGVF